MAHLFTRHDPFHLHKTFGLFALLNFLLRFYYVVRFGTSFPATESKSFACASVFIHAMLPAVSLFLPLPSKRNFASPMIWPEFRLHSVLFSSRHVMSTLVTLLELWPTQIWGSQTAMPVLAECPKPSTRGETQLLTRDSRVKLAGCPKPASAGSVCLP